jgi:hypothetical protein
MDIYANTPEEIGSICAKYADDFQRDDIPEPSKFVDYQGRKWFKVVQFSRSLDDHYAFACFVLTRLFITVITLGSALIFANIRDDWASIFRRKQIRMLCVEEKLAELFKKKDVEEETELSKADFIEPEEGFGQQEIQDLIASEESEETLKSKTESIEGELQEPELDLATMQKLPPEIKNGVLQFLSTRDLVTMRAVSNEWKTLISANKQLSESLAAERKNVEEKIQATRKDARLLLRDFFAQVSFTPFPFWKLEKEDRMCFKDDFSFFLVLEELKNYQYLNDKFKNRLLTFLSCSFPFKEDRTDYMVYNTTCLRRKDDVPHDFWNFDVCLNKDDSPQLITVNPHKGGTVEQKSYAKQLAICLNFFAETAWKLHEDSDEFKKNLNTNKYFDKFRWMWVKSFSEYIVDNKDIMKLYLIDERDSIIVKQADLLQKKRVEKMKSIMNAD